MVASVLLGLTLLNPIMPPARPHVGPRLQLTLHIGKAEFFEQEPIYAVFELFNNTVDTAWISPFDLGSSAFRPTLKRGDGSTVPRLVFEENYVPLGEWRGVPVAPGERLYATGVLQDGWGAADSTARGLFIRHLSPGSYDLSATFLSEIGPYAGAAIEAEPVHFSIRERSPGEEALYREVKTLTSMANDRVERPRYLSTLLTWVSSRMRANDLQNPYLAFLLHNGVQIAKGVGSWPDAASAARLTSLRVAVVDAQRQLPAGAYAVDAGYADRPDLVPDLAQALGQSLAANVAGQREKEHHSKLRPRP